MFNQAAGWQASIVGPGAPKVGGVATPLSLDIAATGFLFVPGWTFLGATYDAVIVQPIGLQAVGTPVSTVAWGVHDTYIVPAELSWKLGDSGFFVKTGFGLSIPDGSISGPAGLSNIGSPWWTFIPQLSVSYLKDGWNLSAIMLYETNTKNSYTNYQSGDTLDVELVATKTIGKWTFGPVGYYVGQVTDDKSSAYYHNLINTNRFSLFAAGAVVGYNFGPANFDVWAVDEFSASASGATPTTGSIPQGFRVFSSISFRLWDLSDNNPTPKRPQFFK